MRQYVDLGYFFFCSLFYFDTNFLIINLLIVNLCYDKVHFTFSFFQTRKERTNKGIL